MNASKRSLWQTVRSSYWFVAANVVAGVFHYLFQVSASRSLSSLEFAKLNAWFADIALFFLIGGLLQYAANFFPAPRHRLRQAIVAINLFCVALTVAWFAAAGGQTFTRAIMVLSGAAFFGWLMGQVQSRMMFVSMTIANLLVGLTKFGLIFVTAAGPTALERYSFALFACYLPALWWISVAAWRSPKEKPATAKKNSWALWAAPILLSAAAAVIPQMDLVLMSRIQSSAEFQEFARASLFYKGIYFLMFIFAQWLLPQQIRATRSRTPSLWLTFGAVSIAGSAAIALISPLVTAWLLKWDHAVPPALIFESCLNMCLLTWVFLEIQSTCAAGHTKPATAALSVLAIEAGLQLILRLPPNFYLILAIAAQAALLLVVFLRPPAIIQNRPQ